MEEYLSLYDYLGRAAGDELGKRVASYASYEQVPIKTKHISNPAYTGEILMYPKTFLDKYFAKPPNIDNFDEEDEINDDLPF